MHVYVNSFRVEGKGAFSAVMRAIHGWLRQKMELDFTLHKIIHENEFSNNASKLRPWLKTYVSDDEEPKLYAWRLKHQDRDVSGRQWVVELGLKVEGVNVEFSCLVQTEEQSTLVRDPIDATRPVLVAYVLNNVAKEMDAHIAPDVPGLHIKKVGGQSEDYRALKIEIEREGRDYPLVLVSPNREGEYLVNSIQLQEALFGLAQVVEVQPGFDSYDMEEELGRYWSVWDGAVNILGIPRQNGHVFGLLLRSEEIEGVGEEQALRASFLLAKVTHSTNIPRQRNRVRPEGVTQLALRRRLSLRSKLNTQDPSELKSENEMLWKELENLDEGFQTLQQERDSSEMARMRLEDIIQDQSDEIRSLRYKSIALEGREGASSNESLINDSLVKLASRNEHPTPEECLDVISACYGGRCEILPSAWESAKEMSRFQSGRRLLDMLRRLMTEYYDGMKEGGDNLARTVFTSDEYSATESESVMNNSILSQKRKFSRNGEVLEMYRHLRIGKADNVNTTLRVHFAWIPQESKIIIGYCGKHLPISSH